jgi:hypothetical protein
MAKKASNASRWAFTLNNPSPPEVELIKTLKFQEHVKLVVAGWEKAPITGTVHIQGYLEMETSGWNASNIKEILGGRAHVEKAKASTDSNVRYCLKQGSPCVIGGLARNAPKQVDARMILTAAKTLKPSEFEEEYPATWLSKRPVIERFMLEQRLRNPVTYNGELQDKNVWIWGQAGLGKSIWAGQQGDVRITYRKNPNKWWDGFLPFVHRHVIIEDWPRAEKGNCLAWYLKVWGDRYPFNGEVKGFTLLMEPARWTLVITSNYPPNDCFLGDEDVKAIERRFKVLELTRENKTMIMALNLDPSKLVQ